jgi:hypothetical protein
MPNSETSWPPFSAKMGQRLLECAVPRSAIRNNNFSFALRGSQSAARAWRQCLNWIPNDNIYSGLRDLSLLLAEWGRLQRKRWVAQAIAVKIWSPD